MKKLLALGLMSLMTVGLLAGCDDETVEVATVDTAAIDIVVSDQGVTVEGVEATNEVSQGVYIDNDIIYYETGMDFTYGAGDDEDAHESDLADAHTVVYITEAGTYSLSGELSLGQIAVDLGEDAVEDADAVVTLILNGIDVTCEVAPALIFYNVYECGSNDTETAIKDVDTSAAGANVIIADDTVNNFTGSHVTRIYDAETVILSADGSEVEDYSTLHKYDATFYSVMTMNIDGDENGTGVLNIVADNEGLDSELHMTINGGIINIVSGNDCINTNEDYVSVTTINGGEVTLYVDGATGEGDGIDSNGWLVINGGTVIAQACAYEGDMSLGWMGDAGIDSDLGIHINGGTIFSTGHMLDEIADSEQNYVVFILNQSVGEGLYEVKDVNGDVVAEQYITNQFSYLIVSYADMADGDYTLWSGETQLGISTSGTDGTTTAAGQGMMSGMMDGMMERPEMSEDMMVDGMMPEDMMMERPEMTEIPEGMMEGMEIPEGMEMPEMQEGMMEGMEMPEGMEMQQGAGMSQGGMSQGGGMR